MPRQFSFRREGQKRTRNQSAAELEQVDGTYAESSEAYGDQFDSENEALRLENMLLWIELPKLR